MPDQQQTTVVDEDIRPQIGTLLRQLSSKQRGGGVDALKTLFLTELNYERENKVLSVEEAVTKYLDEDPLLFASGADGEFHIIYLHLNTKYLSLSAERTIVTKLLSNHLYALFIFSDRDQSYWHFLNVKNEPGNAKRRVFRRITIGPDERLRTATERLALLDLKQLDPRLFGLSALDIQNAHDMAFDVEAVTTHFFNDYKRLFRIFQKDLYSQTNDLAWAHDYALQFLNRCMFLYFIQRKRWLGENTEFLKLFWESYKRQVQSDQQEPETFFTDWLSVLFFEAFNNRFSGHYRYFPSDINKILSQAPYLNGGLFRKNELDTYGGFTVSDERFAQIFGFFERYNFTISEDSPLDHEVAVDPEMIGKVYESLVNVSTEIDEREGERGDAGIFYTPRVELDLMCRLSLVDYLTNHLGDSHKPLLYDAVFALEPEDKEHADVALTRANLWRPLAQLLQDITVVDPACGSGAFLVGMLAVLDDLLERAETHVVGLAYSDERERSYRRKKQIIGNSLYGVDVMEWAIHIAELRLWLALIIDLPLTSAELHVRHEPLLPYFTFKLCRGDSLVQEVGGINFDYRSAMRDLSPQLKKRVTELKKQKLAFYNNDQERELHTKEDVRREEKKLFTDILQAHLKTAEDKVRELELRIAGRTERQLSLGLEGMEVEQTKQLPLELLMLEENKEQWEKQREQLKTALVQVRSAPISPFVWHISFVEVFANGKFDIVIGNPPYVRQELIADPFLPEAERSKDEHKREYKKKLMRAIYAAFPKFFGYDINQSTASELVVRNKLDGKSDLYIYFYLFGLSLLNENGAFSFITSNSWLDVGYGAKLQEFLLKHCHIKFIIDNELRRTFATASVNTVITLFSAPEESNEWGLTRTARFVMFREPFEQLLSSAVFRELESKDERTARPAYRVYPISQQALLKDGSTQPEPEEEQSESKPPARRGRNSAMKEVREVNIAAVPPITNGRLLHEHEPPYKSNKWGGKYLRAPDIYWTILEKGKGKLVRLGDIAEVRFGIKTGANEFFYLDAAAIRQWGIEPEFLRPVIQTPRECKGFIVNPLDLKQQIFICQEDKENLRGKNALEYIKWGESKRFHNRPSCASRAMWWSINVQHSFDFVALRFRDKRNWSPINVTPSLFAGDVVFVGVWQDRTNVSVSNALANTTLAILASEIYGRVNLGDGLLTTYGPEIVRLDFVNPSIFQNKEQSQKLLNAFDAMARREVKPIFDEINQSDRLALDAVVFDALGLTQGERDAVYEAVIGLVEARLNKAKSLDGQGRTSAEPQQKKIDERKKRVKAVENITGIWLGLPVEQAEREGEHA